MRLDFLHGQVELQRSVYILLPSDNSGVRKFPSSRSPGCKNRDRL